MPTTAQQVNTLLYHLTSKQPPPFPILFWSALQKIDFDYSAHSIEKISQMFANLGKRHMGVANILSQQGGGNFLLAIASYLAKTLAIRTAEPIIWYDFEQISQDIAEQNQRHNTQFSLPTTFENSLTAKIGKVYCQPLKVLSHLLDSKLLANGEVPSTAIVSQFLTEMEQAIVAQSQVNLLDNANSIAQQYLAKIRTGKLLDKSIGFYAYLADITFDFSQASLHAIDAALTHLAQAEKLSPDDYARIVSEPANQACIYLLGFYIGATSSQLANVASKWVDYDEMSAMIGDTQGSSFVDCIEHRFVQLMQNHYRTPMLVVTNRLFNIAPNFPKSAVTFAQIVDKQNRAELHIFLPKTWQNQVFATPLPAIYQQAMHTAGQLLTHQLKQVTEQRPIIPTLIQADSQSQQTITLSSMDNDSALDKLYRQLAHEAVGLLYQVAGFGLLTNLPLGQLEALALEIRVNKTNDHDALALQLLLPYRLADDSALAMTERLVLYPLLSNQPNLPNLAGQLVYQLYQSLPAKLWQACGVEVLTPWQLSPLQQARQRQREQQQNQRVDSIDLPLLPLLATNTPLTLPSQGLVLTMPPFDYEQMSWRGYDLPKYILDLPDNLREYLQVVVPDRLIGDELFSQAENLQRLYRYGKVVWGIIIYADADLYKYDTTLIDTLVPAQMLTADILYDPTGQASVNELQQAAEQLHAMLEQPLESLPPDQSMYALHAKDPRSRVFGINYPKSLQNGHLAPRLKISTSWLWRLHLPNGMLTTEHPVVPLMLEPDTSNQPINAKGRLMILPSRFWSKDLYQNWLAHTQRPDLEQNGDLLPTLEWQERQGYRYVGKGVDAQLFPKFKFDTTQASHTQTSIKQGATKAATIGVTTPNTHPIPQPTPQAKTQPSMATPTVPTLANTSNLNSFGTTESPLTISTPQASDKLATLSPELQQQLLRDQARLQAELSTTDSDKEKKLYLMVGVVVALIVLGLIVAKVMAK